MRLRHARGSATVLVWLRCAAHDASRESCVYLASSALFRLFVQGSLAFIVLLGLTWRSTGARL